MRLHLGCGQVIIPGWTNVDMEQPRPNAPSFIAADLRKGLPFAKTGSVDLIFSEHFIEHISRADAVRLLRDCRRVLSAGGTIRLATPNLDTLAKDYCRMNVHRWDASGWLPQTPAQLMNEGMRLWGHTFLYDALEIRLVLVEAGFDPASIAERPYHWSPVPDLCGIERRPYFQDLIIEAMKF